MLRFRGSAALLLWLGTISQAFGGQVQVPAGTSINAGLTAASPGDTVCVEGGTYYEQVALVPGVVLLGGFDAGFAARDPDTWVSLIHGEGVRSCLVSGPNATTANLVDGFTFRGAGGAPGAAIRVDGGSPVFTNNEISENRLAGTAGGVSITGGSTVRFSDNEFRDNSSAGSGGAIRIENSAPVIERNLFVGNVARNSGGAFYVFNSTLTATDNTIRDGRAGNGGGAAFFIATSPEGGVISGTTIEDCEAGHGAAILIRDESSVEIRDSVIRRCSATASTGGYGGGVFLIGFSSLRMDAVRLEDCSATADGGGIYSFRSTLNVTGPDASVPQSPSAFVNCSALGRGGGVWVLEALDLTANQIVGARFTNCSARDEGGGFYFEECQILFAKNVLERCSGTNGGGGTIVTTDDFPPPLPVTNNTFYECSSTLDPSSDPGGALAFEGSNGANVAQLVGNVISNTLSGACIACTGGSGVSSPRVTCNTMYNDPTNSSNLTGGNACNLAFQAGGNDERDPGFCTASPTYYRMTDCLLNANCDAGRAVTGARIRGATDACGCAQVGPDETLGTASVEESSWGQVKARYRR